MGAFPPTAAGEERHTRVLTPVHECVWDVSPGSAAAEGQPVGGGRAHEDRCCFRGHCPELSYHRLLPSRPSPFPSHPRAACRGMGAREEHAAALRHWEPGGHGMGAARMCCGARASPVTAAFPSLPCRGCDPLLLLLLFTHVSQSQPGTLGQGKQMYGGSLGRALHIFPMAIHIQYVSGRQHW